MKKKLIIWLIDKKTMEAAEVLQGVTMVERGVSRLLTVAFEDVKEDLA